MFNPKQKLEYLEYCEHDKKVEALFKYVEKFEEKAQRDICQMHTDEVLDILVTMSKSTATSERSRLIKYFEWCRANKYCKVNWLDKKLCPREKFVAALEAVEDKYYISQDKYQEYVSKLSASYDGKYDLPIFMCMYEGIQDYVNFAHLTTDDIDVENRTLNLFNSGEIKITSKLSDALMEASKIDFLNNKAQKSSLNYTFKKNSIWKSSKDIDETGQVTKFRRRFVKIKEILEDDKLSISNISSSGIFNYIVSRTKEDGIDIMEDISQSELSKNQLNLKYQKYFMEKRLALNFWEFKYRFQDYFRYVNEIK